eukprot:TRINITY_DN33728_c0_g1_i1.p1 TRINITY_DN33728_c0_g1~~TRINITY_DN33728_c0_g1_i1.p1  ORF type:complete len:421 (+),score=81.60 TRINITY_DN33728_c0_g1_i1:178-1440(+)
MTPNFRDIIDDFLSSCLVCVVKALHYLRDSKRRIEDRAKKVVEETVEKTKELIKQLLRRNVGDQGRSDAPTRTATPPTEASTDATAADDSAAAKSSQSKAQASTEARVTEASIDATSADAFATVKPRPIETRISSDEAGCSPSGVQAGTVTATRPGLPPGVTRDQKWLIVCNDSGDQDAESLTSSVSSSRSEKIDFYKDCYGMDGRSAHMMVRGEKLQEKGQIAQAALYFKKVLQACPACMDADINLEVIQEQLSGRLKNTTGHCYLPQTMFWTSQTTAMAAEALKEGDLVFDINGGAVKVDYACMHQDSLRNIVNLKTRAASLSVTADHRIVVPGIDGRPTAEKAAGELQCGDKVFCGKHAANLTKVGVHKMRTKVVELRFAPDSPVESFIAPKWSLLSKGDATDIDVMSTCKTDDGFD